MKPVLQLRSSAGLYGAERMVLALDRHLPAAGQASRLACIGNHHLGHSPLHEEALRRHQDAVLLPCNGRLDTGAVTALRGLLRTSNAECIHAHDPKSVVYAWLATRGLDCRCVATTHGWIETGATQRFYNRIERALLKRYDAVAVVAQPQVERLVDAGVSSRRIHPIANGIELPVPASADERETAREHYGCGRGETLIAAIGRLAPEKNFALLLKAMAQIDADVPVRLLIAGDGPEYSPLALLANAMGLESRVVLLGHVDDCSALYAAMDMLALPSLSEGMPLVVLEAMAAGKPVLASAVGDVPALLAHAPSSKLLPLDEASWAAAIKDAIGMHVDDHAARRHVREHHSAQVMAERYADLYHQLRSESGVARAA